MITMIISGLMHDGIGQRIHKRIYMHAHATACEGGAFLNNELPFAAFCTLQVGPSNIDYYLQHCTSIHAAYSTCYGAEWLRTQLQET